MARALAVTWWQAALGNDNREPEKESERGGEGGGEYEEKKCKKDIYSSFDSLFLI